MSFALFLDIDGVLNTRTTVVGGAQWQNRDR